MTKEKSYADKLIEYVDPASELIWQKLRDLFEMDNLDSFCPDEFGEADLLAASLVALSRTHLEILQRAVEYKPEFTNALARKAMATSDIIINALRKHRKKLQQEIGDDKTELVIATATNFACLRKHISIIADRMLLAEIEERIVKPVLAERAAKEAAKPKAEE